MPLVPQAVASPGEGFAWRNSDPHNGI